MGNILEYRMRRLLNLSVYLLYCTMSDQMLSSTKYDFSDSLRYECKKLFGLSAGVT